MSDDPSDPLWRPPYDVGYKKPPKSQRFAKGESGNPRGRPPKKQPVPKPLIDKSMMATVLKIASREVTVRDGEAISKISAVDAVIQTMATAAMKGNVPAQRAFVELVDRARKDQAVEIRDDLSFWRGYVAIYDRYIEGLQKAKEPIPKYMPHPDDIVFEEGHHVTLRGGDPIIAAQNRSFLIRFRDVLMLQSERDRRCYPFKEKHEQDNMIFVSDILLMQVNSCLPKRMQLSDDQILFRLWKIMCLSKRTLEQQLKAGFGDLGALYSPKQTTRPIKASLLSRLRSP